MDRSADSAVPAEFDDLSTRSTGVATAPGAGPVLAAEEVDTVVVHVALRPRRGSARRCLAGLAALAAAHPDVAVAVTGLSKDERAVRVIVGVELGPRAGVARFSPQAQAAYAFVSDLFTGLYDHMPVYSAEPGPAERAAAAGLLGRLGVPAADAVPTPRTAPAAEHVLA